MALLGKLARELSHIARRLTDGNPPDLPNVERRHGSWHHADLEWLAPKVATIAGDFGEIGVFRGAAFRKLATLAAAQNKLAHAFDSFAGMAEPTAADGTAYPKGRFDIGGPAEFLRLMDKAGVVREQYRMWPGYVPECFGAVPPELRFSLVILDLDHYQPTVDALQWLLPRISAGGILALDDYIAGGNALASKAIGEFLAQDRSFIKVAEFNQQLILQRRA
jgi:hypothetical protein